MSIQQNMSMSDLNNELYYLFIHVS